MASTLKVDTIAHTGGTTAMTVDSGGFLVPKVPAFEVIKTTNQTVTTVWEKVTWESESYDISGGFDLANDRFTPTVAGIYQLNVCLAWMAGNNKAILSVLRKNGAEHRRLAYLYHTDASFDDYAIATSTQVEANGSGDYFEVWAYCLEGSGGEVIQSASNGTNTVFSGHLIGTL